MPRKRQIKPSIFANPELGAETTDPLMMTLFAALWCLADREGRLEDRAAKIVKAFAFPYRTIDNPDGMLQWLHDHGFIVRYWVHGKRYLQIVNFKEHQDIHPHEARSVIPDPLDSASAENKAPASMSLHVMTSPDIGPRTSANVGFKKPLPSFPSYPSFPSLEEGAAIAAVDISPNGSDSDKTQAVDDPVHRRIWTDGKELLMFSGMTADQAGPLLGRWAKEHGRTRLAEAIASAQAANPPNPKDYIGGVLRRMKNGNADMQIGKTKDESSPEPQCSTCGDSGQQVIHSNDVDAIGGVKLVACPECNGKQDL